MAFTLRKRAGLERSRFAAGLERKGKASDESFSTAVLGLSTSQARPDKEFKKIRGDPYRSDPAKKSVVPVRSGHGS
jgi:hypothetical protein